VPEVGGEEAGNSERLEAGGSETAGWAESDMSLFAEAANVFLAETIASSEDSRLAVDLLFFGFAGNCVAIASDKAVGWVGEISVDAGGTPAAASIISTSAISEYEDNEFSGDKIGIVIASLFWANLSNSSRENEGLRGRGIEGGKPSVRGNPSGLQEA